MILVIDNYDSFTFNLVQALETAGADLLVVRNDRIDRAAIERLADAPEPGRELRGVLVSPGPGNPSTAGVSMDAIRVAAARGVPVLGVCLGHQCLGAVFGAEIVPAPTLVHGQASVVGHSGAGVLAGLASPFTAGRYHSLCVDAATLPAELEVTARADDGVVMAMRHRTLPLEGVQFHPESVLTPEGPLVLANFLRLAGEGDPELLDEAARSSFATRGWRRRDLSSGPAGPTGPGHRTAGAPALVGEEDRDVTAMTTEVTAR
jgi:anthranilate synthase/aminodeoxychorismate synthase-like glutamine amidotransferase